ncbi:MAG: hypothetical protein K6E91_01855 [Butyrivibrio sp.]|nr:hypothetical protein [Butyrivibrio sp.]
MKAEIRYEMTSNFSICREKPYPLGCYIDYDRSLVVRSVFKDNKHCGITLYPAAKESALKPLRIELPATLKRGSIYSARIKGIENIASYGAYNLFADDEIFCDPYAKQIFGLEKFGKDVPDCDIRAKLDNKADFKTSHDTFDWDGDESNLVPYEDSLVYLLHVRGFTKSPSSGVDASRRGTFTGITDKIPYLKSLGVTTVELMPAYEMNEVENLYKGSDYRSREAVGEDEKKLVFSRDGSIVSKKSSHVRLNFWGYKKGFYFAPRTAYCSDPSDAENEFKRFVKTMHEHGLEVIMQFYFDEHENGTLIIDALRFWRCTYHVDGFHLKGSVIPLRLITREPLFDDTKIWYDWFDYGSVFEGKIPEIRLLGEYNNGFLFNSRRFLKSDDNSAGDFLRSMTANSHDHAMINYICDYEGFRLADLVTYEHKHNEENGENNKDGTDNNLSWNCGIEGRTRKHDILSLRKKQIKNAMTMLMTAQGTPMIFSGDEFGNTQGGNNNPYCQDNETGWVDWRAMERNSEILEYFRFLSNLRFGHRILHESHPFRMMDYISCGYPDLSFHGRESWRPDLSCHSHMLGFLFCGLYEKTKEESDAFIYIFFNMHWTSKQIALPKLPDGYEWDLISDTDPGKLVPEDKGESGKVVFTELIAERSARIYISKKVKKPVTIPDNTPKTRKSKGKKHE